MSRFIIDMRHEETARPKFKTVSSLDEAVKYTHEFFLQYEGELRDGRPFDPGNEDGATGGFDVYSDVKMHDGKVLEFVHSEGEGPCCRVVKEEP